MRVAFVLDEAAHIGGGFQQSLSTIVALQALQKHEIVVLTSRRENVALLRGKGLRCEVYEFGRVRRMLVRVVARNRHMRRVFGRLPPRLRKSWGAFDEILDLHGIDLVVCFFLSWVPQYLERHPFIATVYDLCHREHCEFPEVSGRGEFNHREISLGESLPRALSVLVSSRSLGRQISKYYGVDESRVAVLPFLPASHARGPADAAEISRVREKYALPEHYIFYPAQFWPHKNHVYLLEGLRTLGTSADSTLHAVFSGSDFGNQRHVREVAQRLGLAERVHFLGFVESADMGALYTAARVLVMPTYFGPTNIPPLEAIATGCPVIYSDFPEFRAELGDAALYCDLRDPVSLGQQLRLILTRPEIVDSLARSGRALLQRTDGGDYVRTFQAILDDFDYIRRRWTAA
jgi:glycosyltransferase involved in cell wall biosynthesis